MVILARGIAEFKIEFGLIFLVLFQFINKTADAFQFDMVAKVNLAVNEKQAACK
jgi:hypothetical protein